MRIRLPNLPRKRFLLPLVGLVIVILIVVLQLPWRVTDENFGQIQNGMSPQQVEGIIGPPDYEEWHSTKYGPVEYKRVWVEDRAVIIVTFSGSIDTYGEAVQVSHSNYLPSDYSKPLNAYKLICRIKDKWRWWFS